MSAAQSAASRADALEQANKELRRAHRRRVIVAYTVLTLMALFFLFPLAFMVVSSLCTTWP